MAEGKDYEPCVCLIMIDYSLAPTNQEKREGDLTGDKLKKLEWEVGHSCQGILVISVVWSWCRV